MALGPNGLVPPGPARGSISAQVRGAPGTRVALQGRPPTSSPLPADGVVPPPPTPDVVPPPPGSPPAPSPSPRQALTDVRRGQMGAGPGSEAVTNRQPTGSEMDLMTPGQSAELPVGTYTVTEQGPMVMLNEQGAAKYQARLQKFAERFRSSLPPDMRNLDVPIPEATVGQRVFNPWTGQWMTV